MKEIELLVLLSRDLDALDLKGVDAWETGLRMAKTLIELKRLIESKEQGGADNAEGGSK